MLKIHADPCDDVSRRMFLRLGASGLGALSLPSLFRARDASAREGRSRKDTRVILIWLEGGPSHMDLWDMKPQAPAEYRGYWRPIATNADGLQITEMFPKQSKVADKFSIVRSIHHGDGEHVGSSHIMLTGRAGATVVDQSPKSPSLGSVAAKVAGPRRSGLPAYVVGPEASGGLIRPGYFGGSYLGSAYDPFETRAYPNSPSFKIHNLTLPSGMTLGRLEDRRRLRESLDTLRRDMDRTGAFDAMDQFEKQAAEFVTSSAVAKAFDIASESEELRARYGRNDWGQGILLARRLAEAGVTFTAVNLSGWDQHVDLKPRMEEYLPKIDAAVSSLFEDLSSRGLLDQVLVVMGGEMSRAPRMSSGHSGYAAGRDHWSNSISYVLGGGGVKGGRVVGATDPRGEFIVERAITPGELHATIYHVLGIDPTQQFVDRGGRPVSIVDDPAPIRELF
jgi:hypothetical protein